MRQRLEILQRLVALYSTLEEMHSLELQLTTAAVREAQEAVGVERKAAQAALLNGRVALLGGDCEDRIVAETQQEISMWRQRELMQVRIKREERNDAALKQYAASRLKREQLNRIADGIAANCEIEERRRAQAVLDDRFLTRKRWTESRMTLATRRRMKDC